MTTKSTKKDVTKALLCYPPTGLYQRGEERCQADIEGSATQAPHAPNDLGYLAAQLQQCGVKSLLRDYPVEKMEEEHVLNDIQSSCPELIIISTTSTTLMEDAEFLEKVKNLLPGIIAIAKGSCFFSYPVEEMNKGSLKSLDIAIYGEAEFVIPKVIDSIRNGHSLESIEGLIIKNKYQDWIKTPSPEFCYELDTLPFPDRSLIKNELYQCPKSGRPMATIVVSRGCPAQCIYCLTPTISGRKLRSRSVDNVLLEIKDCIDKFGIRDFFFRADTFTMDKKYVMEICSKIVGQQLKINWVANSRTDTLDEELVGMMKRAGCWLIAFGVESGNDKIQQKIKKNSTADQARRTIAICKASGVQTFGFFMIGFPWDSHETIEDTMKLMQELDCDFIEVHIATPFEGTELNQICKDLGLLKKTLTGHNYFSNPTSGGTLYLTRDQIIQYRKRMLTKHFLRPNYILRTFAQCSSFFEFFSYAKYGLRLLFNTVIPKIKQNQNIDGC